jgi:archaeal cell division control protein 6
MGDRFFRRKKVRGVPSPVSTTSELSLIFKDREKLSPRYVPTTLLHRENQMSQLGGFFKEALVRPDRIFLKPVQLIGPAGTGKTSTLIRFGEKFTGEAKKKGITVQHVYVNLKLQGGSRVVLYRYLLEKATPEVYSSSLSAEEMLRAMVKELYESKKYLVISLDEIDYFIKSTKETRVVYDLARLNEIDPQQHSNVIGVIFVARNKEWHEKLDDAELSTLGRFAIEFPPYRSSEILDILTQRSEEAFQPGALSPRVLEYIADLTASPPVTGDIRYALDLLLFAGMVAENQASDRVRLDQVRFVHGELHPSITEEDIMNLPKKEHVISLLAVVRSLKSKEESPYTTLKEIRLNMSQLSEEMNLKPLDDLETYVQDLNDRGLIEIHSLNEIGIKGASTRELEGYVESLLRRIQDGVYDK